VAASDHGLPVRFGVSTLERWLHKARREKRDPVGVLRRKIRTDVGAQESLTLAVREALRAQYAGHMSWSVALHHMNLRALAEQRPELGCVPSYSTIRRFLKAQGLFKRRRLSARRTAGVERAEARLMQREVRSYEAEHVGALWHFDAHHCSLKVMTPRGGWVQPVLFGVIDDRSRLLCHLQWYLDAENMRDVAHGLMQALLRRGLPRAVLSDNGSAMCAAEITEAFARLSILHDTTLSFSPYMNGKIETLWTAVEGQLLAMLESVADLDLEFLNEATQAWLSSAITAPSTVKQARHRSPAGRRARMCCGRAGRRGAALDLRAHRAAHPTAQRRHRGHRCAPLRSAERVRHLDRVLVRYARWDLSQVHLVDEHSGQVSARLYPLDKAANANGIRRPLEPVATRGAAGSGASRRARDRIAPLLENLMAKQRATGLPPRIYPKLHDPIMNMKEKTP